MFFLADGMTDITLYSSLTILMTALMASIQEIPGLGDEQIFVYVWFLIKTAQISAKCTASAT